MVFYQFGGTVTLRKEVEWRHGLRNASHVGDEEKKRDFEPIYRCFCHRSCIISQVLRFIRPQCVTAVEH